MNVLAGKGVPFTLERLPRKVARAGLGQLRAMLAASTVSRASIGVVAASRHGVHVVQRPHDGLFVGDAGKKAGIVDPTGDPVQMQHVAR